MPKFTVYLQVTLEAEDVDSAEEWVATEMQMTGLDYIINEVI